MAKLAAVVDELLAHRGDTGTPALPERRVLAQGDGWEAADVVCACGPEDRPFEEQHTVFSIAVVASGTFEYRSGLGRELMTPGALMLGSPGQSFECSHDHGAGDRCIAFSYEPARFERLAADAGARGRLDFPIPRIPPHRALAPVVAMACAGLSGMAGTRWEEVATLLAGEAVHAVGRTGAAGEPPSSALARVARCVRLIDRHSAEAIDIDRLADLSGLSPYHFLRTFRQVTGVTPHQYLLRVRLREAARLLATGTRRILDVALDCGFGDVSNFNRSFKAEFGVAPRHYARGARLR